MTNNNDTKRRADASTKQAAALLNQFDHTHAAVVLEQMGHNKASQKHAAQSDFWGALANLFKGQAG